MKQFHKSHASFCRSLISTLLSFLTIFRSRNFFEFSPMSSAGEKIFLFRYTPCVLCTQDTGYPVRQTTSHRMLYGGDGKTNWTDCIKAAKKGRRRLQKNFFFNYGLLGWGGCRTLTAIWWRQLIRLLLLLASQFFSPKSQSVTSSKSISP